MPVSRFNPNADYVVARPITVDGVNKKPGELLPKGVLAPKRMELMFDHRLIRFATPEEIAAGKVDAPAPAEEPKDTAPEGNGQDAPQTAGADAVQTASETTATAAADDAVAAPGPAEPVKVAETTPVNKKAANSGAKKGAKKG